jgi:hypothetical protein
VARAHAAVLAPALSVPRVGRFDKRWRNSDSAAANSLVFFAAVPFGTPAVRKHVVALLLAHPDETTAGISNTVSSGPLAWWAFIVTISSGGGLGRVSSERVGQFWWAEVGNFSWAPKERLLLTELGDLYSGYFDLLSQSGRFADAFTVIEEAHGRIEAQELEYDHTEVPHAVTPDENRLNALQVALVKRGGFLDQSALLREIRLSQPKAVSKPREITATLEEVQARLKPHELLIEYVLSSPKSFALAITAATVKRHDLPDKELIEAEAGRYRDTIRAQHVDFSTGSTDFSGSARLC